MYTFEVVADEFRKHPDVEIQLPKRGTQFAAAYDFFSPEDVVIAPGEKHMIWTDVKAHIPSKYVLVLNTRSSMGFKYGIWLANVQGWCDADFYGNPDNDGNIGIALLNTSDLPYKIHVGDRIAQGMILKYFTMDDDDANTIRTGGFGSTGK